MASYFRWCSTAKNEVFISRNGVIKIVRKERLFTGQRYRRMEDQNPGHELACNLGFAKVKGLESKV